MDGAAIKRNTLLFLFVGSVIIAVIYLIGVSNGGSDALEASGTVEVVSVLVGPEAPGRVMEVYVEEGAFVEQGEPLFSLDDEILRVQRVRIIAAGDAALTAANLQLLMVQQALDDLYEDWPLAAAQAELELAHAQDALDDVVYVHDVRQEGKRASKDTIDAAEANLILAENEVDRAKGAYDSVSGRSEDDPTRALALSNLVAARKKRDSVLRNLNWYTGKPTDIEQALQMRLLIKPTTESAPAGNNIPYSVEVAAIDHPGIVNNISRFFSSRNINIVNLQTERYAAPHTGSPMFALHMTIGISADTNIAQLRDAFMQVCDELNLDAELKNI